MVLLSSAGSFLWAGFDRDYQQSLILKHIVRAHRRGLWRLPVLEPEVPEESRRVVSAAEDWPDGVYVETLNETETRHLCLGLK